MLTNHKKTIEKHLNPLVDSLSNVNPNILTILGIIPPIAFFVALVGHHYVLALLFFLGTSIDMLDGLTARKFDKVTAFGGFLDSLLDRVSDYLLITAFAYAGLVRWEIAAALLLVSFLTSYARSRGELAGYDNTITINKDISFAVGLIERTERLIILFFSLILYILFPNIVFAEGNVIEVVFLTLIFFSGVTVLQRIIYAYKKLK